MDQRQRDFLTKSLARIAEFFQALVKIQALLSDELFGAGHAFIDDPWRSLKFATAQEFFQQPSINQLFDVPLSNGWPQLVANGSREIQKLKIALGDFRPIDSRNRRGRFVSQYVHGQHLERQQPCDQNAGRGQEDLKFAIHELTPFVGINASLPNLNPFSHNALDVFAFWWRLPVVLVFFGWVDQFQQRRRQFRKPLPGDGRN